MTTGTNALHAHPKPHVIASYVFFIRTSWRNRVLAFLRRLRSPRYALALLVGFAYFFFALGGPALLKGDGAGQKMSVALGGLVEFAGPLLLSLFVAFWWILGKSKSAIALSPAEASLLVPAPLSRRDLIHFKLLLAQPPILFTAGFMTLALRGSSLAWWLQFPAAWLLFTTLQLHQIGSSLVHAGVQAQGRSAWKRMWPVTLLAAVGIAIVMSAIIRSLKAFTTAETFPEMGAAFSTVMAGPWTKAALAPVNAVLAPINATSVSEWAPAFGIAAAILILHYVWVINTDAAFEEGAVEAGARRAAVLEDLKKGKQPKLTKSKSGPVRRPWFALPPNGEPAYAIWWKSVLSFTRALSPFIPVVIVLLAVAIIWLDYTDSGSIRESLPVGALILATIGGAATLLGPVALRNDLRSDLRRIELLRTLPVRGAHLVAAEIGATSFSIASVQLPLFATAGALLAVAGNIPRPLIVALAAPAFIILILAINAMMLLVHNGFALLFPAWTRLGNEQPGGIEHIGQNILVMLGGVFLFALSLVAPLLIAIVTTAATVMQWRQYAVVPAGVAFLGAFVLEILAAIVLLGAAYDRLDPVDAGLCK